MDKKEQAAEMRATGLSYQKIGKELGVHHTTVSRWLNPDYAERNHKYQLTLEGRCRKMLCDSRRDARRHGHQPVNITLQELLTVAASAKVCGNCGADDQKLYLDHCHKTGDFRDFLCCRCNSSRGVAERKTSGFVGVVWQKQYCKWQAAATINKKIHYIGLFTDEISAAHVRDAYVRDKLGKAYMNNPPERRKQSR